MLRADVLQTIRTGRRQACASRSTSLLLLLLYARPLDFFSSALALGHHVGLHSHTVLPPYSPVSAQPQLSQLSAPSATTSDLIYLARLPLYRVKITFKTLQQTQFFIEAEPTDTVSSLLSLLAHLRSSAHRTLALFRSSMSRTRLNPSRVTPSQLRRSSSPVSHTRSATAQLERPTH